MRLHDDGEEDAEGRLLPASPEIRELTGAMRWHATRSALFRHLEHINAQELEEVLRELRSLVGRTLAPQRVLTAQDNTVTLCCWGKGRSGSRTLNRRLRSGVGWQILGRKSLYPFRLASADNVADDPSREVEIRAPSPPQPWMIKWLSAEPPSAITRAVARLSGEAVVCPRGFAADEWGASWSRRPWRVVFEPRGSGPLLAFLRRAGVLTSPSLRPIRLRGPRSGSNPVIGERWRCFEEEITAMMYDVIVCCLYVDASPRTSVQVELIIELCKLQQSYGRHWIVRGPVRFRFWDDLIAGLQELGAICGGRTYGIPDQTGEPFGVLMFSNVPSKIMIGPIPSDEALGIPSYLGQSISTVNHLQPHRTSTSGSNLSSPHNLGQRSASCTYEVTEPCCRQWPQRVLRWLALRTASK